ncbi:MAG: tRNA pseudouridine(38-40) synthase TruA [Hyphomicrobiaceae bacterium]
MPRYRLILEYDGTPFAGWQVQEGQPSVQARIAAAIQAFTGETVVVKGAGRTDSGVHALGQVAHIDLARDWPTYVVREALNANLRPDPVVVLAAEVVTGRFDARFSAIGRHYLYRILNRRAPPALDRNRVWHVPKPLDVEAMHLAAQHLVGRHDFTTYRSGQCQAKSPVKTLDRLDVTRAGSEIHINAHARSFLHNQVRSMVGSLKHVGEGKWRPIELRDALAARNRAACGVVAPPQGLYLVEVSYPPDCPDVTSGAAMDTPESGSAP